MTDPEPPAAVPAGLPTEPTGEVTPKTRGPQLSDPSRLRQQSEHHVQPLTWKSFSIGLTGVVFLSLFTGYIDAWMTGTLVAINHLPTNALFIMIFVLALFNGGLRYFNRRWFHLEHSEMMLIFAMTSVTAAIPVYGRMCYAVPVLAAGQKFKSSSNDWERLLFSYYPQNNRSDGSLIHMTLVPEDPLPPVKAEFIQWAEYALPAAPYSVWKKANPQLESPPQAKDFKNEDGKPDRAKFLKAIREYTPPAGLPDWTAAVDQPAFDAALARYNQPAPVKAAGQSESDFQNAKREYEELHHAGPPEKMEFIRWEIYAHDGAFLKWLGEADSDQQAPPDIAGQSSYGGRALDKQGQPIAFTNLDGSLDRQKYRKFILTYQQPPSLPDYTPFIDLKGYQKELQDFKKVSTPVSDFFGGVGTDKRIRNDLNAAVDFGKLDYGPWLMPILNWSILLMAMYVMMTSMCALLRKQWVDRERLTFPLAQVPIEIVGQPNDVVDQPFFTSRWPFLIGFPLSLPLLLLGLCYYSARIQKDNHFDSLQTVVDWLNNSFVFTGWTTAVVWTLGLSGLFLLVPWLLGRSSSFFRNPLTWIGILIPVLLHSFNALQDFEAFSNFPILPLYNKGVNDNYLTEPPWSAIGETSINFYPSAIGLVYLLSLEVSFSIWFFYVLERIVAIFLYYAGYGKNMGEFTQNQSGGINSFLIDQGFGALLGMVIFGLWMARRHLIDIFKKAIGKAPEVDDADEAMSYRTGLLVFIGSFATMVIWMNLAGIDLQWALLFTLLVMVILIGLSRLVTEGGLFYVQCQDEPLNMIQSIFSPVTTGSKNVVMMGLVNSVATFDLRATAMPPIFNAYKFCGDSRLRLKGATIAILIAILVSMVLSMFAMITLGYQFGANNLEGGSSWTFVSHPRDDEYGYQANTVARVAAYHAERDRLIQTRRIAQADKLDEKYSVARRDYQRVTWVVMGFFLVIVFMILRQFIFWWPHPIGYVSWCSPAAMIRCITSIFLGWLIKWAIVKYGGFRVYFKLRPLFVGLIVGEALIAIFWLAVKFCIGIKAGYPIHIN